MAEHTFFAIVMGVIGLLCTVIGALLLLGINKTLAEMKAVWEEIKYIKENQANLRAELPLNYLYVKGAGFQLLMEALHNLKDSFDNFAQDCKDGKCGGKKG